MVYLGLCWAAFSEVAGLRVGRMDLGSVRCRSMRPSPEIPRGARYSMHQSRLPLAEPLRCQPIAGTRADSDALVFVSPEGGPSVTQTGAIAFGRRS